MTALKRWERWAWLAAQGALIALTALVFVPSEAGLSAARLTLLALLVGLATGFASFAILLQRGHRWAQRLAAALSEAPARPVLLVLAVLLGLVCGYLVLLTAKFTDAFVSARLVRLLPLTALGVWLAFLTLFWLPSDRAGRLLDWAGEKAAWKPALWAGLVLFAVAIFMAFTGLGLQPDRTGWDTPGAPVLNTQVALGWGLAALTAGLLSWANRRLGWGFKRLDAVVFIVIWVLSAWLWIAQPALPTYFSSPPSAPNWELYPNSDAATVDIAAQHLLIGAGLPDVIEKPLYAVFLAGLHALVGQDYATVVNAQTIVLALFPAVLYLLASRMHTRFAGILLAAVLALREANTLALSGDILVSHSKLLMTDLPTALALAGFALLLLNWLQNYPTHRGWALGVGAVFGLLLLLRSQILIFLPFLLVLAFWQAGGNWRGRLRLVGLLLAGFVLAALPWLLRNAQRTGEFGYSQPLQMLYMAKQYSLTPELADPGFPVGTPVEEYVSRGAAQVRAFVLAHPGEVVRFISAHTLRNEVTSLLALPMRFDLADRLVAFYNLWPYWQGLEGRLWSECCSLDAYLESTPYWGAWQGDFPSEAWLPLVVNLALVALGVGAAWRKLGWLSLVPVGLHVLYSASTALARVSGWRLILPVDWVVLLFYCLGLAQLTGWVAYYLFGRQPQAEPRPTPEGGQTAQPSPRALLAGALLVLLLGAAIPLLERLVPNRYADLDSAVAVQQLDAAGVDASAFLQQPGVRLYWGRALYPGYFAAGAGLPSNDSDAFSAQPFGRLAFRLVGPGFYEQVALPASAAPALTNASDVIVLGCPADGYLRAAVVLPLGADATAWLASGPDPLVCP